MSKAILTRLDGAENLTANVGFSDVQDVVNDFDSRYPWNSITEIEDANGEKWIRILPFYTYYETNSNGVITGRKISEYKIDDNWFLNPIFTKGDRILPYVDVAKYLMSNENGIGFTRSGDKPIKNITPKVARQYANAKSDVSHDVFLENIWVLQLLQDLFAVEFATTKCQEVLKGYVYSKYSSSSKANGTTDIVPYVTGTESQIGNVSGTHTMKYRGIENLWGNGQTFIDGIKFDGENILVSLDPVYDGDYNTYVDSAIKRPLSGGVVYQLKYDNGVHLSFPVAVNSKGRYENVLSTSDGINTVLYNGNNSDNCGLWTYSTTVGATSVLPHGTYRLVRRPK